MNPFAEPVPSGPAMREPLPTPPSPAPTAAAAGGGGSRFRSIVLRVLAIVAGGAGRHPRGEPTVRKQRRQRRASTQETTTENTTTEVLASEEPSESTYEEPIEVDYEDVVRDHYRLLPGDPDACVGTDDP